MRKFTTNPYLRDFFVVIVVVVIRLLRNPNWKKQLRPLLHHKTGDRNCPNGNKLFHNICSALPRRLKLRSCRRSWVKGGEILILILLLLHCEAVEFYPIAERSRSFHAPSHMTEWKRRWSIHEQNYTHTHTKDTKENEQSKEGRERVAA